MFLPSRDQRPLVKPAYRPLTAVVLTLFLAASASPLGCTDFDQQDHLEDIRILAVRMDPPEIHYSPAYFLFPPEQRAGFPLSGQTVNTQVYAFDPRGGLVESTTRLCPDEAGSCLNFDANAFRKKFPDLDASSLNAVFQPRDGQSQISKNLDPTGPITGLQSSFDLNPDVLDTLIQGQLSLFPITPVLSVDVKNTEHTDPARERAFKRLPLLIDFGDPAFTGFADNFLAGLGFSLCTTSLDGPNFHEGDSDCLDPRPPNTNPELLGFRLETDVDSAPLGMRLGAGQADLATRATLSAARGSEIAVTPVLNEDVSERYQIISIDIESQRLLIKNRQEDVACTWYVTKGALGGRRNLTALQFTQKLTNSWVLPSVDEAEAGEKVAMVVVVRDQRGGVAVGQITVELR